MKRLFQINNPDGKPFRDGGNDIVYTSTKQNAKNLRDTLNAGNTSRLFTVSPGPDHKGLLSKKSRGHIRANRKES